MKKYRNNNGFTLVEVLVTTLLLSIILTAGMMLFISGQNAFVLSSMRASLQDSGRKALQRISFELQESGRDSAGVLKVSILDGTGVNGTDILRFSVPLCVCGMSPIDSNGNVSRWGAPVQWGQAGCTTNYPVGNNGKVDICHFPPGNPNNTQNLSVSVNAVKAHLAHGDYIGACASCSPNVYTNRTVEYLMNNNGQMVRRILDVNNALLSSVVVAQNFTGFQTNFNAGSTVVTVAVQLAGLASQNRTVSVSNSMDILLRN